MLYFDHICRVAKDHQMKKVVSRIGYHYFDIMSILIDNNLRLEHKNGMVRMEWLDLFFQALKLTREVIQRS